MAGAVRITKTRLEKAGFRYEDLGDDPPYEWWIKHKVHVWHYNGHKPHWIIDMLDQAGITAELHYMYELEAFFRGCKIDMYAPEK